MVRQTHFIQKGKEGPGGAAGRGGWGRREGRGISMRLYGRYVHTPLTLFVPNVCCVTHRIWGLFEEPLYPYLYVNLPVYDELVDGTPLLDGQVSHTQQNMRGGRTFRVKYNGGKEGQIKAEGRAVPWVKSWTYRKMLDSGVWPTETISDELIVNE
jgi:hypothetical protein